MDYFGDGRHAGACTSSILWKKHVGTAGGVRAPWHFFEQEPFLVWYGDNLSRCDVGRLSAHHAAQGSMATLALHYRADVSQSGIVASNQAQRIVRFLEKPQPAEVFSHWVMPGIYVLAPAVLDLIAATTPADFARDVFPALLHAGLPIHGYPSHERRVVVD